jgi:hypothetical protein
MGSQIHTYLFGKAGIRPGERKRLLLKDELTCNTRPHVFKKNNKTGSLPDRDKLSETAAKITI